MKQEEPVDKYLMTPTMRKLVESGRIEKRHMNWAIRMIEATKGEPTPNQFKEACEEAIEERLEKPFDWVFEYYRQKEEQIDETNPQNIYGESKLLGEQHILSSGIQAIIIRTSWVYSEFGNNFVKTMFRLGKERETLNVVNDQFGSPTYAKDLAITCMSIIDQIYKWSVKPLIFHYCNKGIISWNEFAKKIMIFAGHSCKIHEINSSLYPTKAQRPSNSSMSTMSICGYFNINIPDWQYSLKDCFQNLLE